MGRRKKGSARNSTSPMPAHRNQDASGRRAPPEPNPAGPNRTFLVGTGVLLALWILFLAVLALAT